MIQHGSVADRFLSLSTVAQCDCAILACEMAIAPWERLLPKEGESFTVPDAFLVGRVERSFGREAVSATRLHRDHLGQSMESAIEQLCLDVDLAILHEALTFQEPALDWAAYAFMNLVLAATGKQTRVSDDIPDRNPFLLAVNQAITAVAFFRSRREGTKQDRSTSSIDPCLLDAVTKDWWAACEGQVTRGRRTSSAPRAMVGQSASMRVDSPDGAHHAELSRSEESAGCHGVGGYHAEITVVRVFDRAGREVLTVERALRHVISENAPDELSGTTIESVRFSDDGKAVILALASGEEVTCAV